MVIFSIAACFKFPVLGGLFPRQKGWNALPKLGLSRPTWKNLVVKIKLVHLPRFGGVNNPKKTNPPIDVKSTTRQLTLQGNSNISLFRLYALLNKHSFPAFPFAGTCYIYVIVIYVFIYTLWGINISHLGKRKTIFKIGFSGDMLVPWRVYIYLYIYMRFPSKSTDGNDTHTNKKPACSAPRSAGGNVKLTAAAVSGLSSHHPI